MALGKNLKRKKLIAEEPEEPKKKKAPQKKKPTAKKDQLINKSKPTKQPKRKKETPAKPKKVAQAKPVAKKKSPSPPKPIAEPKKQEASPSSDPQLPIYIAKEIFERKSKLRNQYDTEIAELKNKIIQFVVIEIGGEAYALDIDVVKEVVPIPPLSKTPNTPDHIKGIANVRGSTYVVYDLATKFKVIGDEIAKFLLVIDSQQVIAGLMLSVLPTTFKERGEHISSAMNMIEDASLDVSYIKGIIQHDDKIIYYLDIIELLKNDKAIVVPDNFVEEPK